MDSGDFRITEHQIIQLIKNNNIDTAMQVINTKIARPSSEIYKNSLFCLKAECNQLRGNLYEALESINTVNPNLLIPTKKVELELLKLKIDTQSGKFQDAVNIFKMLSNEQSAMKSNGAIWRGSLAYACRNDSGKSEYYGAMHHERCQKDGFQEANNLLYTKSLTDLIFSKHIAKTKTSALEPILKAENIYATSIIDFSGKVGNRLKSRCQAFLLEGVYNYEFGDKYSAYVKIILCATLMKECGLVPTAEGIGEIIVIVFGKLKKYSILYLILCKILSGTVLKEDEQIKKESEYLSICIAEEEAVGIAADILLGEKEIIENDNTIKSICKGAQRKAVHGFNMLIDCHPDNKENIDKLLNAMKANIIIPFFGAGISACIYPLWSSLLKNIASGYSIMDEVDKLIENGKFEEAASEILKEVGEFDFRNILSKTFSKDKIIENELPDYLYLIPKLWKGVIITTNFDAIIENAYGNEIYTIIPRGKYDDGIVNSIVQFNKNFLIKIHGDINNVWDVILTKEEYDEIYGNNHNNINKIVPQLLSKILVSHSVLFVGCGLKSDRTMHMVLENAQKGIQHFALVELPKETVNDKDEYHPKLKDSSGKFIDAYNKRRRELADFHISRIWYPYGKHQEALDEFLNGLRDNMN